MTLAKPVSGPLLLLLSAILNTAISIIPVTIPSKEQNRIKYQYSERLARPEKSIQLVNPDLMASGKFIGVSLLIVARELKRLFKHSIRSFVSSDSLKQRVLYVELHR